jgi:HNH endonuclease
MGKRKHKVINKIIKDVCIEYLVNKGITDANTYCNWKLADCIESQLDLVNKYDKADKSDQISFNRLKLAYTKITGKAISYNSAVTINQWQTRKANGWKPKAERDPDTNAKAELENKLTAFYQTYEWRKLRYIALQKYGRNCMICGSNERICVDHILSVRKYWSLRLDITNLQILCEPCNHGKGNWDKTDWRDNKPPAFANTSISDNFKEYFANWPFWDDLAPALQNEILINVSRIATSQK